ncbi:conjugal transfer protein TraB [Streptomyces capoamus]|uniref:Conjugal transfer protein TraB n=1 Tax=Streptomyces capoamus TaxID=68183 RepID=A0A919F2F6_9ACTN|nr:conjugal transfer protein TraB [Streptomyces capoamus]GGP32351.1 conjugal transfer protein TraB [Streptomyces libani subsp. rufus]GHG72683.1 conjugal transfer protein TraB [Streptomyces capoamus]
MSSDLAPRTGNAAPAVADDDNRYKTVQAKLDKLGKAMDDATLELEALRRSMQANAKHTDDVANDIENADLDPKFVGLTANVATALDGAARDVRTLSDTAQETADLTHETRRTHAKFYGALDDIRSNRREKTPRPGFFNR